MLRERLLNPIIDTETLNFRYNSIESMLNRETPNFYKVYEDNLSKIQDLERLHRKMSLQLIQPSDFSVLDFSYDYVKNILNIDNTILEKIKPGVMEISKFNEFIKEYHTDFNMEEIVKFHLPIIK